jgi:hypothetical protein
LDSLQCSMPEIAIRKNEELKVEGI